MSLNSCPPSFKIVKLGNPDAERDAINAALQAIVRCMASSSLPSQSGHAGYYLTTDGTNVSWAAIAAGQVGIQYKDVGTNLGTSGTVNTLDFTGAGVTATRVGDVVTVDVPGSSGGQVDSVVAGDGIDVDSTDPVNPVVEAKISADVGNDVSIGTDGGLYVPTASGIALQVGGTGEDGDADLDGVNNYTWATRTGNNYVLSGSGNNRTPFINRLRISTGCTLNPSGRAIFARQWDVTSGYHGKVISNGGNGSSATTHIGASGGTQVTVGGSYYPQNAGIGAGGGVHGVASGNSANGGNLTTNRSFQGGEGVRGGQGGAGSTGTPGTGGNPSTFSYLYGAGISPYAPIGDYGVSNNNGEGGGSGTGGTGGTGDGTNAGGGGGGGGAAGGGGDLSIGEIVTDGTTPAYMIKATGGNGGDGATRSVGNVGGGGGGGPGGGGGIRLVLGRLVGPSVAAFLDASGGNGGNGGNGVGTGANGNGAAGAKGGSIRYFNLASGLVSVNIRPAGTPASGAVGGTGGVCTVDLA